MLFNLFLLFCKFVASFAFSNSSESDIIIIINSSGVSETPSMMTFLIISSARICSSAVNFVFYFYMVSLFFFHLCFLVFNAFVFVMMWSLLLPSSVISFSWLFLMLLSIHCVDASLQSQMLPSFLPHFFSWFGLV